LGSAITPVSRAQWRSGSRIESGLLALLAGGWLSGRWSADPTPTPPARQRLVARFDMTLPENHRKLQATETLGALAD
jgi:hypothetical protein